MGIPDRSAPHLHSILGQSGDGYLVPMILSNDRAIGPPGE